ncbi:hypothetical protein [Motiliproteus sp. MSK22-1]|uniref:anti-sigma factor n=1 Tax=Motiliproteus sp. MSK22-1 TaxID=1897630 RepID=UPI000975571E|nr:hypothetical protein [Motiliproteus sp. MSK22-1]OMH33619.1 hypothetical protein BGP75_11395 [Motiliproteus sp. MSK22-1]
MSRSLRYLKPEIRDHLAAQYVLGTLSSRTRQRFESLLHNHPELETDVYRWQQRMNPINDHTKAVKPPAHVWRNLQSMLKPAPAESTWKRLWGQLSLWQGGFALAMILSLSLWLLPADNKVQPVSYLAVMQSNPPTPEPPMVISAYQGDAPGRSRLHIQWNRRMASSDLEGVSLWAINRDTGKQTSLGDLKLALETRLLTKQEWLAIKDSSELVAVEGDLPDGPVRFRGPCLQLSEWQPSNRG